MNAKDIALKRGKIPESAYNKDGSISFSGVMMIPESCPKSFKNWTQCRSPKYKRHFKKMLSEWKKSGFPSIGNFPPQELTELSILDYALGAMSLVVESHKEFKQSKIEHLPNKLLKAWVGGLIRPF